MTTDTHKMIIRIIDCLVKKNVYQEKSSLKCDSEPLKQTILVPEQVPPGLLPAKFVAIENWKGHGVGRSGRPPINVHLELEPRPLPFQAQCYSNLSVGCSSPVWPAD